jgi:hypothetical protein
MGDLARAFLLVALGAAPALSAQSGGGPAPGAPTPACALLSVAEVRTITGRQNYPDYVDGDPDGEGAGGGSSCQYGGLSMVPGGSTPLLSVVLIRGKNWTERAVFHAPEDGAGAGGGGHEDASSSPPGVEIEAHHRSTSRGTNDLIVRWTSNHPRQSR